MIGGCECVQGRRRDGVVGDSRSVSVYRKEGRGLEGECVGKSMVWKWVCEEKEEVGVKRRNGEVRVKERRRWRVSECEARRRLGGGIGEGDEG